MIIKKEYESDLKDFRRQIEKIVFKRKYNKHIEHYKNSPIHLKAIEQANQNEFEKYKDIHYSSEEFERMLKSLDNQQLDNILKAVNTITDPNNIKNLVNPSNDFIKDIRSEIDLYLDADMSDFRNRFLTDITSSLDRVLIKQSILEMAEKSYPEIIRDVYPKTLSNTVHEYFDKNKAQILLKEMSLFGYNETNNLSLSSNEMNEVKKELDMFLKKTSLSAKINDIKSILKDGESSNDVNVKNKLR